MIEQKKIIDAACGSRMFWFDKNNPKVTFCDNREVERHEYYHGRYLEVKPDVLCDFRNLPFDDNRFKLVVFDPPHLRHVGENSWMKLKYGNLPKIEWTDYIHTGFNECYRVLSVDGVLIFKWNETQITVSNIIKAIGREPLFGHKSGKASKTHWLCFMKIEEKEI